MIKISENTRFILLSNNLIFACHTGDCKSDNELDILGIPLVFIFDCLFFLKFCLKEKSHLRNNTNTWDWHETSFILLFLYNNKPH